MRSVDTVVNSGNQGANTPDCMPACGAGDLPEVIYTPESPLRHPAKLVCEMIADLKASRGLAWRLFVRDMSALYRQSLLGYVWAFLPPVATTAVFIFLNSQSIINVGKTSVPYPAFVMIGTLLWQIFLDALNAPLKAIGSNRAMLAKINFPREALIVSGVGEVFFNFLIRLVLLIPVFVFFKIPVGPSLMLFPLGVAALLLLGLAFGVLLAPLGILYGDVGRAVGLVGGFWMLLTPVVYPSPTIGVGATLARWNPVVPVLQTCRDWLTSQPAAHLDGFLCISLASFLCLLLGWVFLRLSMPILIERMGG